MMKPSRREFLRMSTGVAAVTAGARIASAQTYPTRPITIIVPYTAGSSTDLVARVVLDRMRASLGQPLLVENVGGAGGSLGAVRAARAAPDGYTVCIGNNGSHVLAGALYQLPVDLVRDLEPVTRLTTNPQIIVTNKSIPANDLKELMAWIKGRQQTISAGTVGPMATISLISFQNFTSGQITIVPYRGTTGPTQDLIGGQIDLMIDQVSNASPHIKAGSIRAYAVAAKTRSPALPDVPTVDEAGLPGFYGSIWTGMWAPKGTPPEIIGRLNGAVREALADPALRRQLAEIGQEIVAVEDQTPEALAAYQRAEVEKWWPIAKAANLKGD